MSNSQTNYSTYGKFKPKNKSKKVIILIFTFIFVFSLCLFWLLNASSSTIVSFCEAKVKSNSTLAVNQSVYEVLSGAVNYKELVDIQEDSSGAVTLISADVMRINLLAYNVAMEVQKSVSEYSKTGIDIPIGTLLPTPIFTGQGFCINFQIMPIGNIICNVRSEFESAGINQTRHKIVLEVITTVEVIVPTSHKKLETITPVLIAENLIVGKIPEFYLNGAIIGSSGAK